MADCGAQLGGCCSNSLFIPPNGGPPWPPPWGNPPPGIILDGINYHTEIQVIWKGSDTVGSYDLLYASPGVLDNLGQQQWRITTFTGQRIVAVEYKTDRYNFDVDVEFVGFSLRVPRDSKLEDTRTHDYGPGPNYRQSDFLPTPFPVGGGGLGGGLPFIPGTVFGIRVFWQ